MLWNFGKSKIRILIYIHIVRRIDCNNILPKLISLWKLICFCNIKGFAYIIYMNIVGSKKKSAFVIINIDLRIAIINM